MPAPPPSPLAWPVLVNVGTTGLPLVGAWAAGRLSWRDPAGQVGLTWGLMLACSVVQFAGFFAGRLDYTRASSAAATLLLPLLIAPPLFTWVGPALKRRQWPILGVLALLGVAIASAAGTGRSLGVLYATPTSLLLVGLTIAMLAAQARRASDPQSMSAEPGWLWIGGGHLVYFLATLVGRPLLELMVPYGLSTVIDVHMALMLVYSGAMAAITWGIWLGRVRNRGASRAAPPIPSAG